MICFYTLKCRFEILITHSLLSSFL
jgi:hypothetical protein